MRPPRTPLAPALDQAARLLQSGRADQAVALLAQAARAEPRAVDARRLLSLALFTLGRVAEAEAEARAAIALAPRDATSHALLGDVLRRAGRLEEAVRAYRDALARDRLHAAALPLSQILLAQGQAQQAYQAISPLAASPKAPVETLATAAQALKALGRAQDALALQQRAVQAAPADGIAEHNLGATLGDLGRFEEAAAATGRALAKGIDAPETWLVHARALQGAGQLEAAEAAYREAIRRRPLFGDAQRELAQLVWMRTEDLSAATAALDTALGQAPDEIALRLHKARAQAFAGAQAAAHETLCAGLARAPDSISLRLAAAQSALVLGDASGAIGHAERAATLAPEHPPALTTLCQAALAVGDAARAARLAEDLHARAPDDQNALALLAVAWRLAGDRRYAELYDYETLVRAWPLAPPPGWPDTPAFLADLARTLHARHLYQTHPYDQSLRRGSQITHLTEAADPVLQGLFKALDAPIRKHIAALAKGPDVLRRRTRGDRYKIQGSWSVRLRPGGFHVDHVHPEGWLSSAFYVEIPGAVASEGREGWIRFGQPGVATRPALDAEHFIRPEPGTLVLFPSYMWHGVNAFGGEQPRLTVAFDLAPG